MEGVGKGRFTPIRKDNRGWYTNTTLIHISLKSIAPHISLTAQNNNVTKKVLGKKDIQIICLNDTMPNTEFITNTEQTSLEYYFILFFNENSDDNHLRFIIKFPQLMKDQHEKKTTMNSRGRCIIICCYLIKIYFCRKTIYTAKKNIHYILYACAEIK